MKIHYCDICSDEYYWDETYYMTIDGQPYIFCWFGSSSLYIPQTCALIQEDFDYLKNRVSTEVPKRKVFSDFYKEKFLELYHIMVKNHAIEVSFTISLDGEFWYIRK